MNNPRYKNGHLRRKHRARFKAMNAPCGICKGKLGPIHYDEPSDHNHPLSFVIDEITKDTIIEAGFKLAIKDGHFDNGLANVMDLRKLGVKDSQIIVSDYDTVSDDRFYSAYLKTPVGRLVSLVYLK